MADPVRLRIKVVPGASRDGVAGWLEDTLKVRVRAPAERGRANAAVEALVARALGIPAGDVRIVQGHGSARKWIEVAGLSDSEIALRLSRPEA